MIHRSRTGKWPHRTSLRLCTKRKNEYYCFLIEIPPRVVVVVVVLKMLAVTRGGYRATVTSISTLPIDTHIYAAENTHETTSHAHRVRHISSGRSGVDKGSIHRGQSQKEPSPVTKSVTSVSSALPNTERRRSGVFSPTLSQIHVRKKPQFSSLPTFGTVNLQTANGLRPPQPKKQRVEVQRPDHHPVKPAPVKPEAT
ncbi:hypothetical protein VOLCADRAFT_106311 [Volvox carteri f. nagariensis]|uniref:Uncharacterized protein n=1 Tax=Volvox carteri f. nagariensis TaxID=3068 RepID=D8U6H5_VOLCA|nr:uncharacterized protein VOLCADRAFT_106311 [Volvox carteri f. nagariensis]EFJ44649.1 hypothetical protein VOLCADRAFT_106311 [Volvox carteri f. nagariensis]|eukprot:XP_002954225.1 hypothetical protein VOLCADRAFT_106311 [Volvox carteri f. nagariensis]